MLVNYPKNVPEIICHSCSQLIEDNTRERAKFRDEFEYA